MRGFEFPASLSIKDITPHLRCHTVDGDCEPKMYKNVDPPSRIIVKPVCPVTDRSTPARWLTLLSSDRPAGGARARPPGRGKWQLVVRSLARS